MTLAFKELRATRAMLVPRATLDFKVFREKLAPLARKARRANPEMLANRDFRE